MIHQKRLTERPGDRKYAKEAHRDGGRRMRRSSAQLKRVSEEAIR